MRISLVVVVMLSSLGLAACQTGGGEMARAPALDHKAFVLAKKAIFWKDPDSIKNAAIAAPFRDPMLPMWHICVRLNSKNSFGAYSGEREFFINVWDDGGWTINGDPYNGCGYAQLKYEPFPQLNGQNT